MNHDETVGALLAASFVRARPDERAADVRKRLGVEKTDNLELVLALDGAGRLAGVVPVAGLLRAEPDVLVAHLFDASFPRVHPDTDQETAASLALHHAVESLPVVDGEGRPVGVMPAQALLQVLRREHIEDLHLLSGIRRETSQARHAIEDRSMSRARHRLPWLLVGLAGSALATAAMATMESTLQANVTLAFFVPALVYVADAIGTQSEAIAVRGLSLTRNGISSVIFSELRTGMVMGAVLGLVAYLPVLAAFGDARLAAAVSTSVFVAGSLASAIGIGFPWLLARHGVDPAYGSGPLATVIQDILTILVYFAVLHAFAI